MSAYTRDRRLNRTLAAGATAVFTTAMFAGCAHAVPFEPAADASNPLCASVSVRLPDEVAEFAERTTDAQATGAWGDPAAVLLRCGVPTPGPTTDRCVQVNGVDWVIDESDAPRYLFTTYGRTPAVEVLVDNDVASGTTAITELSAAVSVIPQKAECVSADDAELDVK